MNKPTIERLYAVTEATWPARKRWQEGCWTIREGGGAGSRVSSATLLDGVVHEEDIGVAEAAMRDIGQVPLFMVREGEAALDGLLANQGYAIKDPVRFYIVELTGDPPAPVTYDCWPPLEVQKEIWKAGGIGAARLDVMARGVEPKTTLLARKQGRAAGTCYVGVDRDIAMAHAIEVPAGLRRQGAGRALVQGAMRWAMQQGASWLSLIVTEANSGAHQLYASLGMSVVGHYHYRIKAE
jgi:GNAT superfamily N-acetyltransferase